jgi:hypothetical protein
MVEAGRAGGVDGSLGQGFSERARAHLDRNQSSMCLPPLDTSGMVTCRLAYSKTFWLLTGPIGNQSGPPGPLSKVQNTCQEALSAFGKFGKRPAQTPCKRTLKHGGIST